MNITILGAGSIGSYLARMLSQEGHSVVIIDHKPEALEKAAQSADIATRLGSGTDWRLLEELAEQSPDYFIAVSSNDETNLVACTIAKKLGYPKTIARIRQNAFLETARLNFRDLFLVDEIIGTELIIAHDIFKHIIHPGNIAVENFAHGSVQMQTFIVPKTFEQAGKPLAQIQFNTNLLIGVIRRSFNQEKKIVIFPRGQDFLLPGDEVTLIGETETMQNLHAIFDIAQKEVGSAVLIGGSGVALHLMRLLEARKIKVKLIEQEEQTCLKFARLFPSAIILNHSGTDLNFLKQERVHLADVFVTCTHSPETNIVAAALGKQAGCEQVMAVVHDENVVPLLQRFDVSYTLSEQTSIARRIHLILHSHSFISLAPLYDNEAQIIEVKISAQSHLIGAPISALSSFFPKNFLIAMIENREGITIPKGNTILSPGDTAIVICGPEAVRDVERLL
jgi:trk system potassium uptake protein